MLRKGYSDFVIYFIIRLIILNHGLNFSNQTPVEILFKKAIVLISVIKVR
jgi:hypothetical protein